jgi:hypothetical protein
MEMRWKPGMPTLANANIPPPKSWDEFEDIVLSAAKLRWSSTEFYRHGRQGQRQQGVDIYGDDAEGRRLGIQGKNSVAGVSERTIVEEIVNAESFEPPRDALYIATTAKRDATIQKVLREISAGRRAQGKFSVGILFWDDIVQDLARDESEFFKHFPQFRPSADPAKDHDRELYDKLTTLLSSAGVIGFLDRTNMAGWSFDRHELDRLGEFHYEWNRPEREFIDPDLEALRRQLWLKADDYLKVIAIETFPAPGGVGRQWVPEEWEEDQPERFERVVTTLHSLAGEIVKLHGKLVRTGRSLLLGAP